MTEISTYIHHHEQTIIPLYRDYSLKFWDLSLTGSEESEKALIAAKERYLRVYNNREEFRRMQEWKKANPPLHVTPLVKEKTGPRLAFRIGMGVRGADQNWKRVLNRLIQENQPAINKILLDYGVPLLDENDRPLGAETATKAP